MNGGHQCNLFQDGDYAKRNKFGGGGILGVYLGLFRVAF